MLSGNPFDYYRYFSITARDRDWGLYLTGAGRQTQAPGVERDNRPFGYKYTWESGRVFEDTYSALLFVEGSRIQFESEVAGQIEVSKGDMVLLCCALMSGTVTEPIPMFVPLSCGSHLAAARSSPGRITSSFHHSTRCCPLA